MKDDHSEYNDPDIIESDPADQFYPGVDTDHPAMGVTWQSILDEEKALRKLKKDEEEASTKERFDIKRELFDWSESLVKALIVIVILFAFIVRSIGVIGTSMYPTLDEGDYLIVSELFYTPKPGDIVVVTKRTFMADSIVKRIIAVGGQTIMVDFTTGQVFVDNELLHEDYLREPMWRSGDMQFPLTVPEGYVFVMGDNRNDSTDSRYTRLGLIDEDYIVGKVLLRVWPLRDFGIVY